MTAHAFKRRKQGEPNMELMALQAETNMRLANARQRGARAEITYLDAVKDILAAEQLRQSNAKREAALAEAEAKRNAESVDATVEAFNDPWGVAG